MAGTRAFGIAPPTSEDIAVAKQSWQERRTAVVLEEGVQFYRILRAASVGEAASFAKTCYPSDAPNRFTPIMHDGAIVPSAYAASDINAAVWETILRDIRHEGVRVVPAHRTRDRYLIEVSLIRPLRVLNTCRPYDANLVAASKRPPELKNAWPSAYIETRQWMQILYDALPGIEGLLYESHHIDRRCVVLFQPASDAVFRVLSAPKSVREDPIRVLISDQAGAAGAVVDFEQDEDADTDHILL